MNAHQSAALADAKLIAPFNPEDRLLRSKARAVRLLSGSFSSLRTLLERAARPKNNGTMFSATAILTMAQMKKCAKEKPGNGQLVDAANRGDVPVLRMLTRVSLKLTTRNFSRSLAFDLRDEDRLRESTKIMLEGKRGARCAWGCARPLSQL